MVRVLRHGRFSVYIYVESGGRHQLPHCHVRWPGGRASVDLERLERLAGDALPAAAEELLDQHQAVLIQVWERLNPERPVR